MVSDETVGQAAGGHGQQLELALDLRLRLGDAESNILDELDNAEEDRACWEEKGSLNPPLLITGKDLLAAGFQPGPEIKEIMDRVRRAQLNEEIGTKEEALELALRRAFR